MRSEDALMLALALAAVSGRRVEWGAGWLWPVPPLQLGAVLYRPAVSSSFGEPRGERTHAGVDVLYKRRAPSDVPQFPSGTPDGSPWFFAPPGTPIIAAKAGTVWSVARTPRGIAVVLSHGRPFATFYQHLESVALPWMQGGKDARGRALRVEAGQPLGTMGYDPLQEQQRRARGGKTPALRHLHFEVWHGGAGESAVDPEAAMSTWALAPAWRL